MFVWITAALYKQFLEAKKQNKKFFVASPDLGISKTLFSVDDLAKVFERLKNIREKEIYVWDGRELKKPQIYEEGVYSLWLDEHNFPVLMINGVKMNVSKDLPVLVFTSKVLKELKLQKGDVVLETCMGLGYKTLEASKKARVVYAIEKSRAVIKLAKLNPYTREIFKKKNIKILIGDAFEKVNELKNDFFTRIIHDPPTFKFAPQLYSEEFYADLYRVAKNNALLYHYVGDPGSRYRKINLSRAVTEKLENVGWKVYKKAYKGIFAKKEE